MEACKAEVREEIRLAREHEAKYESNCENYYEQRLAAAEFHLQGASRREDELRRRLEQYEG